MNKSLVDNQDTWKVKLKIMEDNINTKDKVYYLIYIIIQIHIIHLRISKIIKQMFYFIGVSRPILS